MNVIALAMATLVSEDLACIGGGLLAAYGHIGLSVAILGCYVGIVLGDVGLYALGRFGGERALRLRPVRKLIPSERLGQAKGTFQQVGGRAIFAARFFPGARVPVYVAAGVLGMSLPSFVGWTALACALWTPFVVGLVAVGGDNLAGQLQKVLRNPWLAAVSTGIVFLLIVRLALASVSPVARARMDARISRLWRWEFWPAWVFYLPLVPWVAFLAIRHRGLKWISVVNPAIPHSGIVGESKFAILKELPSAWVVPTRLICQGPAEQRSCALRLLVQREHWPFPLVLKPDVGERGAGVNVFHSIEEADRHVRETRYAILMQGYHPGPFEAGIFYYRLPDERQGRIFSITDKVFPRMTGDGTSTIEQLVWRHPRYRMQAKRFLARLNGQSQRVLAENEMLPLAIAGNHCQGTEFRDGTHLWSHPLEERMDEIAKSFEGFFFGRFDVRYSDARRFRAGSDFRIVELNGVSSESTNLYDPRRSLVSAYRILFEQWNILFQIASRNRSRGVIPTPYRVLARLLYDHYTRAEVNPVSC